jgi:hypothetical protein
LGALKARDRFLVALLRNVTRRVRNCGEALRALNAWLSLTRYWPDNGESWKKPLDDFDTT